MALGRKTGGRQKGSRNKNTRAAEIAKSGELPLQYMLRVMRDMTVPSERRDDMSKAAAPYVHPKLQAIEHSGQINVSLGERIDAAFRRKQARQKSE